MENIEDITTAIEAKSYDFISYKTYNSTPDTEKKISIVMTTHDRPQQTLYTLKSFINSIYAKQIVVILVDDSMSGYLKESELTEFPFQITYITIENSKKTWINPCINYNLGFNEVKTSKVIIQNAEVCHIGDIIQCVIDQVNDDNYMVFDVCALPSLQNNQNLYDLNFDYEMTYNMCMTGQYKWLQHTQRINRNFHFLSAITHNNLLKLGGFDPKFALGACYDDDELIFRITHQLKLNVKNIINENTHMLGIHQWHQQGHLSYNPHYISINSKLFKQMKEKFN
jgi:hypothetical protein